MALIQKEQRRIKCKEATQNDNFCKIEYDGAYVEVAIATFDEINHDLIQETLIHIDKALNDANLTTSAVQEIVMVGGSSCTTTIQRMVREYFGKEPTVPKNADEIFARGAAIFIRDPNIAFTRGNPIF